MLKHNKYVYVDVGKYFIKVRVLKNRDENSPDSYIVVGRNIRKPRNAQVKKLEDLPIEVRDKIYKS